MKILKFILGIVLTTLAIIFMWVFAWVIAVYF